MDQTGANIKKILLKPYPIKLQPNTIYHPPSLQAGGRWFERLSTRVKGVIHHRPNKTGKKLWSLLFNIP
mgnify:FL=1